MKTVREWVFVVGDRRRAQLDAPAGPCARRGAVVATAISMTVILAACGGGGSGGVDSAVSQVSEQPSPTTASERAPTPTGLGDFTRARSWGFDVAQPDRTTVSVTLGVGEVGRSDAYRGHIDVDGEYACDLDPQRDAVMPFSLELTNVTEGFDADASVRFSWHQPETGLSESPLRYEGWYEGGPRCGAITEDERLTAAAVLTPDEVSTLLGFFILEDYYSPGRPDGDPTVLAAASLEFVPFTPGGESLSVSGVLGPGAMPGPVIPLDGGSAPPGCAPLSDPWPTGAPFVPVPPLPLGDDVEVDDLVIGNGPAVPTGDEVEITVHYVGVACSTGEVFDSSWARGTPATLALGGVIEGWAEGIPGMRPGGRRVLVIPPEMAYGTQGRTNIAPNETLWFVVDLVEVG